MRACGTQCRCVQVKVSQARSEQRAWHACQNGPGHCFRLWSNEDHRARAKSDKPAIKSQNPLPVVIESVLWRGEVRIVPPHRIIHRVRGHAAVGVSVQCLLVYCSAWCLV